MGANLILATLIWLRADAPAPVPTSPSPEHESRSNPRVEPEPVVHTWTGLVGQRSPQEVAERLRSEGFPAWAVRQIVTHLIGQKYEAEIRGIHSKAPTRPYWQHWDSTQRQLGAAERARIREVRGRVQAEVAAILGPELLDERPWRVRQMQRSFGENISLAAAAALDEILNDYRDLQGEVRSESGDLLLPEDREKLEYLQREQRADIAKLLTPEQLAEYDRRQSVSARSVIGRLRYFDASEAEYLALYEVQRQFDAEYGDIHVQGAAADRRKAAEEQLKERFRTALGEARYEQFVIRTDGNYSATLNAARAAGLATAAADEVVRVQQQMKRIAAEIRSDRSTPEDEQRRRLSLLEQEAVERVSAILGERGFAQYRDSAGEWIRRLAPQPQHSGSAR
jgi:hypothetical protein